MDGKTIINVGRQFAARGKDIAAEIGRILDIPVYDGELLTRAAAASGLSPELFKNCDENRRVLNLGSIFGMDRFTTSLGTGLNDAEIFRIQSDVIRDIASKGSAVFVGRAADYILRDERCLNVFVTAPVEARAERIARKAGISKEEAVKLAIRRDKARQSFYNYYTFKDWGVASNYHLCVDSSILGIEGSAQFIIDFGRRAGLIG